MNHTERIQRWTEIITGIVTDIGKIEIHDHFAYVAVTRDHSRTALHALTEGKIKGRKFLVRLVE